MNLTAGEKIRVILKRKGLTVGSLADGLGQSRQNFQNKLKRDSFPEKELREIADYLNCTFDPVFEMKDTGEKI